MAIKIRLARGGSKKRPFYRIVATDSRMPRDGRFIEKLGTYNPLLPKDSEHRVKIDIDRVKHWLNLGAQASDRIQRMLEAAKILPKKERNNPIKAVASKATQERSKAKITKSEPKTDEPVTDQTKSDEPVTDETKTDEPVTDGTKIDGPVTDETKIDEPVIDETKIDGSVTDETKIDEPVIDETKIDGPVTDQMKSDEPVTDDNKKTKSKSTKESN